MATKAHITWEMTPNRYSGPVVWQKVASDRGPLFVAETAQGVCQLGFLDSSERFALRELQARWPRASVQRGKLRFIKGHITQRTLAQAAWPLHLAATPFQKQVWQALRRLRAGHTLSYGELAIQLGRPRSARAVGQAVGANPVAVVVPCHRVLPVNGSTGQYHWGVARKQQLLALEKSRRTRGQSLSVK